ncbi:UNVERIFIED_CONTAM: hypothetical protein NCL1_25350 [Trichonephila clavipes]
MLLSLLQWLTDVLDMETLSGSYVTTSPNFMHSIVKSDSPKDMDCEPSLHESTLSVNNSNLRHRSKIFLSQNGPSIESNGEMESLTLDTKVKCDCHNSSSPHHPNHLSSCKHLITNKMNNVSASNHVTKNSSMKNQCTSSLNALQTKPFSGHFSTSNTSRGLKSSLQDKLNSITDLTPQTIMSLCSSLQESLDNSEGKDFNENFLVNFINFHKIVK